MHCRVLQTSLQPKLASGNALRDAVGEIAAMAETRESLAMLAFQQMDVTDPEFRRVTLEHWRAMLAEYASLLSEAAGMGELRSCDTSRLAKALLANCIHLG